MAEREAVLKGGVFDGDRGYMEVRNWPQVIWAWRNPPTDDNAEIHWGFEIGTTEMPPELAIERDNGALVVPYEISHKNKKLLMVYVMRGMRPEKNGPVLKDERQIEHPNCNLDVKPVPVTA